MDQDLRVRGFLPVPDPLAAFASGSPYALLDEVGRELPGRLLDPSFRAWAERLEIPPWSGSEGAEALRQLRLYYVRVGFLASAYVNQVLAGPVNRLPENIAIPLADACKRLGRPPILSYDGYALYNWKRLDTARPIELGNIDTIQNFVDLYDERWFILVHVEIEALAAAELRAIVDLDERSTFRDGEAVDAALDTIAATLDRQIAVLKRIPERMSPDLYYATFRPYIRFFENVTYEGAPEATHSFRGETGAQSSVIPTLVAFMKIPHQSSVLTRHLADMRRYMPPAHRRFLERVEAMPDVRAVASADRFNAVLERIARFREVHLGWARQYVDERVEDPRGTGGTPFMRWLGQLLDETRSHMLTTD